MKMGSTGNDISFWEENWLGCDALKRAFLRLFSLCFAKEAKVAELGSWSNGVWVWHLVWQRPFFEWEKPLVDQFWQVLQGIRLILGEADSWVWKVGGLQKFSVNSAYMHVKRDSEVEGSPVLSKLWRCKAIPSTLFITWRVLENKIATRINLKRRGVMVENALCCLCGKEEESYRHLFFDCSFAWRVWCLCYKWLGVSLVSHIDPKSNFAHLWMSQSSELINIVWSTIWVGVVSEFWNHMNLIIFKRGVTDVLKVFAMVQVKVWSWISAKSRSASFLYSDWCLEPSACMRMVP